jgi:hypothetical protein
MCLIRKIFLVNLTKKVVGNSKGLGDNIDYAFDVLSEITGRAT